MIPRLNAEQKAALVEQFPAWELIASPEAIRRTFLFGNFREAFDFMTKVGLVADQTDHHPEWTNVYNRVDILLTTHDADGLSERDVSMVQSIDDIYAS